MLRFIFCISFLFFWGTAYGQGIVRGKITDETGQTVIGATVVLKSNPGVGAVSDFDGNYSLKITDAGPQVIVVSFVSYNKIEATVNPTNNAVEIRNFTLVPQSQEIAGVEITAKASREKDTYMEKMKMNSATTIDYISSETIRKTGDSQVSSAVARVPGVSSTSNGFITVRGIGDRYIKTTLNGSVIPTLDPFTNNIRLDLFPTSLVDNVTLSKTLKGDLPGDWAGAYLSVLTKDYPDQLTLSLESTIGYNSQSTFKNILSSDRSSTDWLGFDNGFRDYDHESFVAPRPDPTLYEELVALGLGPYFASIGVTSPWSPGSSAGETYFNLGLVQLGLLAPALINDPNAVADARDNYFNGPYQNQAFQTINASAVKSAQELPNNWANFYKRAPMDFSQSFSVGNQITLFGKPFGFLTGFRIYGSTRFDPTSVVSRATTVGTGGYTVKSALTQEASVFNNGWSALANLAYKPGSNHSFSVLFMPNMTGTNRLRNSQTTVGLDGLFPLNVSQFYEERKQFIYQFKYEGYIPSWKTKIEANASYTDGSSNAPDFKTFTYYKKQDGYQVDLTESGTFRYFRNLDEDVFDSQLTGELPIGEKPGLSRKLKLGGSYTRNDRSYRQYNYEVKYDNTTNNFTLTNNDLAAFMDISTFGISQNNQGLLILDRYYQRNENPADRTFGYYNVYAGFVMADYAVSSKLRVTGGLRIEQADVFTDVFLYDSLGYASNDPRRQYPGEIFLANPGKLNELSLLPSVGVIYKLNAFDDPEVFNLRLNYGHSVARPSIRELSDVVVFDYELQDFVFGNSSLKMVQIDNYDLRLEKYLESGNNWSVSVFYKNFKNHIELLNTNQGYTWQNVDKSYSAGVELEAKRKIFSKLEALANITFVKSQTEYVLSRLEVVNGIKTFVPEDTVSRSMFGQAPYVFNAILNYKLDSLALDLSVSYNIQGRKLVITSADGTPDIFEMPRHMVDFKANKRFGNHFSLSLRVQNILNQSTKRTYYGDGYEQDYDAYRWGTTYLLGLSYKL
ncbi:MAG: TonB-dependent receptor domain-containing protein [Bacteroidia bacterium]